MTTTETETLEHLLLAVAGGDKGVFRRLYDLAAPRIWPVVQGIAARHNCAEDVLQEAFIAIWQRADQYRPERGSAMSWMIAIARYRALDALRRRRPEVSVEDLEESESWADPAPGPLDQALRSATARAVAERKAWGVWNNEAATASKWPTISVIVIVNWRNGSTRRSARSKASYGVACSA